MSKDPPEHDFDIYTDPDCMSPTMEEADHIDNLEPSTEETIQQPTNTEPAQEAVPSEVKDEVHDPPAQDPQKEDAAPAALESAEAEAPEPEAAAQPTTVEETAEDSAQSDSNDAMEHEAKEFDLPTQDDAPESHELAPERDSVLEQPEEHVAEEHDASEVTPSEYTAPDASEYESSIAATDLQSEDLASLIESASLGRRHSVRTEALIQAAARAVVSMRQDREAEQDDHHDEDESTVSYTTNEDESVDETVHLDAEDAPASRPESAASSPTEHSSDGDAAESRSHHGTEDDVFSDRSPRSSINSADEHFDDDALEQMTEKGDQSPHVRSRVVSGVSNSGASVTSDFSRLSRYEKEDFVPTSRNNRPAFRSPSSVRAIQMASPTPSLYSPQTRAAKRPTALPTISRLGSPSVSAQYSPKGRSTPRFKRQEAPLVLLHVTLLPLRWHYGDLVNHFETKKVPPMAFSGEGMKNLRGAWRQVQDRLGDTVLERGILLPHPQNDYEILEERLLEALELPLRRRARILECGHYLGPANEMTIVDDTDNDSEDFSDSEEYEAQRKPEKRHWCKTCKGDIRYEELGSDRIFRVKVYASNGLMSAGAWEACWKEMERVDIEVEPIIDSALQSELSKLAGILEQEQQQQIEAERNQLAADEQRLLFEEEQRLALDEERQRLEAQRQQLEEERRRTMEDARKELEEQRRIMEQEQRERLEEERRQKFEEERQLLEAQRQQFEEQRLELETHRKIVEEEQRQHLEEARRQELEEEQRHIEEQRQQLEEARQQFEEERRQRLEEEELRRLQREEDEAKAMAAPRSFSRSSYVEDELETPATEVAASTDMDGRRRDSDRLREIYGDHGRSPSESAIGNSSPAIHIHVDSGRQREEEQNSRQLATIPAPHDNSVMQAAPVQEEPRQFIAPSPAPPSTEQAYQQPQAPRKTLEAASLPELLGETIRVLLQDPKNVAIAVLVVLIAMLAGQFAKQEERGLELYKPQHYQSHHHQLDGREPVGQVIMNTPVTQHHTVTQQLETVYKTVTAEVAPQKPSYASHDVETIYETVTRLAQETPSRVVETVYHTVTSAAPEVASEFPSAGATPSVVDLSFDSAAAEDVILDTPSPAPFVDTAGLDPLLNSPTPPLEPFSDTEALKTATSEEGALEEHDIQDKNSAPIKEDQDWNSNLPRFDDDGVRHMPELAEEENDLYKGPMEMANMDGRSEYAVTTFEEIAELETNNEETKSTTSVSDVTTTAVTTLCTTLCETVTETVVEMVTQTRARARASSQSSSVSSEATLSAESSVTTSDVAPVETTTSTTTTAAEVTEKETAAPDPTTTTLTEVVRITSTIEVDEPESTGDGVE